MATRLQQHARPVQRTPVRPGEPRQPAKAVTGAEAAARRAQRQVPAGYAFTHDPLTGGVTCHGSGFRPDTDAGAARRADARNRTGVSPADDDTERVAQPVASTSWSDLESGAVPASNEASASVAHSVAAPNAVH